VIKLFTLMIYVTIVYGYVVSCVQNSNEDAIKSLQKIC